MSWTSQNIDELQTSLRKELGKLEVQSLKLIGEGFRSIAAETDDHIVLVGKHQDASKSFRRDHAILPKIAGSLPIEVPSPDYFIESSESFPFGVLCYPKIRGTVITKGIIREINLQNLTGEIAGFLVALHSVNTDSLELTLLDIFEENQQLRDHILPTLEQILDRRERNLVVRWWKEYLENDDHFKFKPVLVHGDLWYENLILTQNLQNLVGVIDFEACGLRDPAADFAPLMHLGLCFCQDVFFAYSKDRENDSVAFHKRIQLHWERREFGGIRYSILNDDRKELADSIQKLRQGPILNGAFERAL